MTLPVIALSPVYRRHCMIRCERRCGFVHVRSSDQSVMAVKWQICCSELRLYGDCVLTKRGAAHRHTTALANLRIVARSNSFLIPLRVGGWVDLSTVQRVTTVQCCR